MSENRFIWDDAINKILEMTKEEREAYLAKMTNGATPEKEIHKFVDEDIQSIENYVARELYKIFMHDDTNGFYKVRKQILKRQDVDYFKANQYGRQLAYKGFTLKMKADEEIWELEADAQAEYTSRILETIKLHSIGISTGEKVVQIRLQCHEDLKKCHIFINGQAYSLILEVFMECVKHIP